ncbi:hypothetical protein [Shewanella kaireitica]|uniref:hypothetical protein n=1 Tax=Shewanella kaireitica TaxID=212021 RepID=UPI00200DAA08|nr:hypothetical protein [Shewanella kaireitica]MCL1094639.1 hypothetical protein [Shewanella kaireitica]
MLNQDAVYGYLSSWHIACWIYFRFKYCAELLVNAAVPKPAFIVKYKVIKQEDSEIFCADQFNEQKISADEQRFGVLYKYVFR